MNMEEDCMNHIHLTNDAIMGNHKWDGTLELLNVIMIGIAENLSEKELNHPLHRLLGALLSEKLSVDEKVNIIENEYHIPMEKSLEEDVKTMCNLSEGIEERAMEAGIEQGKAEGRLEFLKQLVQRKLNKQMNAEEIAEDLGADIDEIQEIIDELRR